MQRAPDDVQPMTAEQAATLKRLATAAYELDAYKPNLARAEADLRIAALAAKLKLLGEPPHTLLRFAMDAVSKPYSPALCAMQQHLVQTQQ